jgi:serine/threonine protein kinase
METIKLPTGTFEYDPTKPLGKAGGFGQVFLGKSPNGEEVAVKKLHLSAADAAHRELRIADELKGRHFEHVVAFLDSGEDADTGDYFVVMPKADGSLQNKVNKNGPLPPTEAANVLLQIVKGLLEVGDLVHRDMKPDNVLFHDGKWKIADFGIARFVEESTSANTLKNCLSPPYAAPEQWRFERAAHATDVYALGCIAFFVLTGMPPFTKDPQSEHQSAPVPPFSCTEPRLTTLVNMCLRKVAGSRPSLSRVRDLLADIIAKPQPAGGPGSLVALAAAAAHVSTKEQEAQAREAAAQAAREARFALARSAHEILADNAERLLGKIHSQAPNAKRVTSNGRDVFECQLGNGQLVINLSGSNVLEPGSFPHSGWDVVVFAQALVNQRQPHYCWSASLWFTKLKGGTDYRWYEASYWTMEGQQFEPYSESPGRAADMVASNIFCGVNFAFGPIAIDDEKEDEFHERWIWLLSKAAVGQLNRPSRMPFGWPPQLL